MSKPETPFVDIDKLLGQVKLPGIDLSAIIEGRKKDIDAVVQANQLALASAKAVADRQTELFQSAVAELGSKVREMTAGGKPTTEAIELARQTIEKALAAMRSVAEAGAQPQSQAIELINSRVNESIAEIRKLVQGK